jgi:ABC-type branched-subunit amino acid transport system ATPase component
MSPNSEPIIQIRNLTRRFDSLTAVDQLNLEVVLARPRRFVFSAA